MPKRLNRGTNTPKTSESQQAAAAGKAAGEAFTKALKRARVESYEFDDSYVDWASGEAFTKLGLPAALQYHYRNAFKLAVDAACRRLLGEPAPYFRYPPRKPKDMRNPWPHSSVAAAAEITRQRTNRRPRRT